MLVYDVYAQENITTIRFWKIQFVPLNKFLDSWKPNTLDIPSS